MVDVYRVRRSQLVYESCGATDERGRAEGEQSVAADQTYLVRVSHLANSVQDSFRLSLQLARPEAEPPGSPLPRRGATARSTAC